ncbi:polymorphic toxin type 44 domain-containing protein [Pseudomonas aeruginosa]|uniref:polymorphic toxin type 44 domain-containing protein n=1 Tax=Pseudomonas aeruginosa TaxID=287 RepID=UPI000B074B51|nr:polymorphic toxin type 44 domain-containing protein [Pseudomonas aeruginosa]
MSKAPLNLVSTTIYGDNTSIDGLGDPAGGGTGKGRRVPGVEASERPFLQVMQEESIIRSGIEKDGYPEVKKKIESKMRSAAAKARKAARDKYSTALEKLVGEVSGFLSFIDSQFGLMEERIAEGSKSYGSNPIYMVADFSTRELMKAREEAKRTNDNSSYVAFWDNMSKSYKAIYEGKAYSESIKKVGEDFDSLALQMLDSTAASLSDDLAVVLRRVSAQGAIFDQQRDILLRELPKDLRGRVQVKAGDISKDTRLNGVNRLRRAAQQISEESKVAAVGYKYRFANGNITPPLSSMEIDELNVLVVKQETTDIGKKWLDYHQATLNSENARVASDFASEIGRLADYIKRSESLGGQAQARIDVKKGIPQSPPGVDVVSNMELSKKQRGILKNNVLVLSWFYGQVKNNSPWDYKQQGAQYEAFGNFNYGATGAAAGFSEQILLRAAGAAQTLAGTSDKDFGAWWAGTPYGDDPVDQIWIKAGIDYAKSKGY